MYSADLKIMNADTKEQIARCSCIKIYMSDEPIGNPKLLVEYDIVTIIGNKTVQTTVNQGSLIAVENNQIWVSPLVR